MRSRCECRLTVIGSQRDLQSFRNSAWEKSLRACYADPLELSPRRFVCQFETGSPDLKRLRRLSKSHPGLVLLLDFEVFPGRIKGLAKAQAGRLTQHQIHY